MTWLRGLLGWVWRAFTGEKLALWAVVPAGVAVFMTMLATTAHIVGRKLGMPVPGAFEASESFMIIICFWPLAYIALRRGHISFELLTRSWSPRAQAVLGAVAAVLGALLASGITWASGVVAWDMWLVREYRMGTVNFPVWPFRMALVIGFGLFAFQLVVIAIRELITASGRR